MIKALGASLLLAASMTAFSAFAFECVCSQDYVSSEYINYTVRATAQCPEGHPNVNLSCTGSSSVESVNAFCQNTLSGLINSASTSVGLGQPISGSPSCSIR